MLFLRGKKKNYGVRATTDLTSKRSHKNMGKQIVLESTRNGICSVDNSLRYSQDSMGFYLNSCFLSFNLK